MGLLSYIFLVDIIDITMIGNQKLTGRPGDAADYERLVETYEFMYDLPSVEYRRTDAVDAAESPFVAVTVGNRRDDRLLFDAETGQGPRGAILGTISEDEGAVEAVNRLTQRETGQTVDEVRPIAFLETEERDRDGIAFTALVDDSTETDQLVNVSRVSSIPDSLGPTEQRLLELSVPVLETCRDNLPDDEIDSGESFFLPHLVNKHVVSRFVGRFASQKLKRQLLEVVDGDPDTIFDACAGDDEFVLTLQSKYDPDLCVANDIAWKTTEILREDPDSSDLVFTNHNVLTLPVDATFDLVVLKNSLHHLPEPQQLETIRHLSDIAEQLLVVDVADPRRASLRSKLWNRYYVHFLGDQGNSFNTFEEFRDRVETGIDDRDLEFGTVETIKGTYYYGSIRNPDVAD